MSQLRTTTRTHLRHERCLRHRSTRAEEGCPEEESGGERAERGEHERLLALAWWVAAVHGGEEARWDC